MGGPASNVLNALNVLISGGSNLLEIQMIHGDRVVASCVVVYWRLHHGKAAGSVPAFNVLNALNMLISGCSNLLEVQLIHGAQDVASCIKS